MVFSSVPAYLDPSNWHQPQSQHIIGSGGHQMLAAPAPPPAAPASASAAVRPGTMSERARMANVPMPDSSLKCPRCESTNTKFCYFNNYSLSQPRHFCKTCRRYWTRGGALRNVPVGGGCRRNKRSSGKSSSKSSPAASGDGGRHQQQTTSTSTSAVSGAGGGGANMLPQFAPLRFMSPLSQLSDGFGGADMALNYGAMSAPAAEAGGFAGLGGGAMASLLSSVGGGGIEPWRLQQQQQFPFFGGLEAAAPGNNGYQFHHHGGGGEGGFASQENSRPKFSSSLLSQLAAVKMEENPNLARQLMGGIGGNHEQQQQQQQQWNSNTNWTELSSFSSSSTSTPL